LTGHNVNRGVSTACVLEVTVALTCRAGAVVQTQTETVTVPPGDVSDSCCTSWAVRQIAPDRCVRVGDGDGLGVCDRVREGDGDGLDDADRDGLGLLLADGLGLLVRLGLVVGVELEVALGDVAIALGLGDGDVLWWPWPPTSRTADVAASEPLPHGELIG